MSEAQTQAAASQVSAPTAFNLIIEGVGYLNRVREVKVKKGPPYLACTINAMMGTADEVEYVSIDCGVVGRQAKAVVAMLEQAVVERKKVIVGFRAGDPKPDFYEFEDRETKERVQRQGLKARLLQVTFAKVNGERIDIPLVERPRPGSDADRGAGGGNATRAASDDDGVASACEDGVPVAV